MNQGSLIVQVYAETVANPIEDAVVEITGENTNLTLQTDSSGKTQEISLAAPDPSLSQNPENEQRPYNLYDVKVSKFGLLPTIIKNVEIYPGVVSIQDVLLRSGEDTTDTETLIIVPENTLFGDYAPKLPEEPIKETGGSGGSGMFMPFVLPSVIIPEYVIVHDGIPSASATNYYVNFTDYIKNVASGEIYSTWPKETIKANVHAIVSFTLNRIFTEWYRSRGYPFTITSSPQYDQKFTYGRTIFQPISNAVDEIFQEYIKLPGYIQPLLAQYSDGIKTVNPGWLSQWGSKALGDQGYNAMQILKNYYGNSILLDQANIVLGLPSSFPGYVMQLGSCGAEIQQLQNQLNMISGSYPAIPKISKPTGKFDEQTKRSVEVFQRVFNLPVTGRVDYTTWYKISYYYIAVSKMLKGIYN